MLVFIVTSLLVLYLLLCKKNCTVSNISNIIIPLLRHFTILGQKNAQNMPRYYTVEEGKNTG